MSPENYTDQGRIIEEAFELLGNRIAVVHLKDFTIKQGRIHIVPVGQGLLHFRPILSYMKYQRPHIHGILESTPEPDMKDSIAFLQQLYAEV